jgi:hypothetical protein
MGVYAGLAGVSSSAIVVAPKDFNQEGPKKDSSSSSNFSVFIDWNAKGDSTGSIGVGLAPTFNGRDWD